MIENVSKLRESHLVAASLMRIEPELRVTMVDNELVDLLVRLPIDDALFYVVTWPSRDIGTKEFVDYLSRVKKHIEIIDGSPLIIAWYDEQQGLFIDTIVRWEYGEAEFTSSPKLKLLKGDNIDQFFNFIRKQDTVVRMLRAGSIKIIKRIRLDEDRNKIQCKAHLVYLRDLTAEYKMNLKSNLNDQNSFQRCLNGYSRDEYPKDFLDITILKAIQTIYPNAVVENSLLATNSEYRKLLQYKNYQRDYGEIRLLPDIGDMPTDLYPYLGEIEGVRFNIDIFMLLRPNKNAFANEGFDFRISLKQWFETLNKILPQQNTFHSVSEMIDRRS